MNVIRVNGTVITTTNGSSVVINNGKVLIDGKDCTPDAKEISIQVEGSIQQLKVDACNEIKISGDVGDVQVQGGDVEISGSVSGSISTMSGDVDCGNVGGSISTISGNIKHR